MRSRPFASLALPALAALLLLSSACPSSEARRAAAEGARLYDAGDYDAALPLLESAAENGIEEGELFYRLAYLYDLKSQPGKSQSLRQKAAPLLEKLAASKEGTLETWYYLAANYASLGRPEEMRKAARGGVEKYGEATDLSGGDLFRLGRLYQFIEDGSRGAAAYRRSVAAFEKEKSPGGVLYPLALLADARTDLQSRHFEDALRKYRRVAEISPRNAPPLFETALAHLGAGNLEEARADFDRVREENLSTEAQYGADVARRLREAGGALERTPEGKAIQEMDNSALEGALQSAADSLRKARGGEEKGEGGAESLRASQRLFFSLVSEWMLRGNPIRETALAGGYADLIRQ